MCNRKSFMYDVSVTFEDQTLYAAVSAVIPLPPGYRVVSILKQDAVGVTVDVIGLSSNGQTVDQTLATSPAKGYIQFDCTTTDVSPDPTLHVLLLIEEGEAPTNYLNHGVVVDSGGVSHFS